MKQTDSTSEMVASADDIRLLLESVRARLLSQDDGKASVADYVRLLQLYRELEEERPRAIEVRWVEPSNDAT